MFLKAWKHKKIADAVLARVQPDLVIISRLVGGSPETFVSDKYVLGYFCISVGIATRQVSKKTLSILEQGQILMLVMDHMFKPRPPDHAVLGSLLNGTPKDMEFQKGATAALKIQSTLAGYPDFQNDPDVLAARDAVKRIGGSPDFIAPR